MMAVTSIILSEGQKTSYELPYDAAINSYNAGKAHLYGIRTSIWVTEAIKEHEAFREAALAYLRMTKDVILQFRFIGTSF